MEKEGVQTRRERRKAVKDKLGYEFRVRFEGEEKKRNLHERFDCLFQLCEKNNAAKQ